MDRNKRVFRYVPPSSDYCRRGGRRSSRNGAAAGRIAAGVALVLVLVLVLWAIRVRRTAGPSLPPPEVPAVEAEAVTRQEPALLVFGYPTDQVRLGETDNPEVFMPTGSGRVESALFGSTRTVQRGGQLVASFHEGIDIAPIRRDRRGRPLDDIYAVADGEVGYVNRVAGNSSYGIYVVLLHEDPVGKIYTLYAHLASATDGLRPGDRVERGQVIGRMGNTSTLNVPMQRAHLHFEIGTMMNRRFDRWFKAQRLTPDHGRFNGWNLRGLDPLEVYRGRAEDGTFSLRDWFAQAAPAFVIAFRVEKPLDYFERHPRLWAGPPVSRGVIVVEAQEGGLILRGRAASMREIEDMGLNAARVLHVDEALLGRNGRRIVIRQGGSWGLGTYGRQWIDKLTF